MSSDTRTTPAENIELMARYGIIHSTTDQYRYKRYLYSKLSDALAQARRDNPSS